MVPFFGFDMLAGSPGFFAHAPVRAVNNLEAVLAILLKTLTPLLSLLQGPIRQPFGRLFSAVQTLQDTKGALCVGIRQPDIQLAVVGDAELVDKLGEIVRELFTYPQIESEPIWLWLYPNRLPALSYAFFL